MKFSLLLFLAFFSGAALAAPQRATHLGNPQTRFAQPLKTQEDLRRVLQQKKLRGDVLHILRLSGYQGDLEDFLDAVARAPLQELEIAPGTLLPAMSTRRQGRAILLKEVLWAGEKPFPAYEFFFQSRGRHYRAVVPKPCSNFWVEQRKLPRLSLDCVAPPELPAGRTFSVCQSIVNQGEAVEELALASVSIPPGATATGEGARVEDGRLVWRVEQLAPGASRRLCADFAATRLDQHDFNAALIGSFDAGQSVTCSTRIYGIPAVLLEVIDLKDPVLVEGEVVYHIRVLNQGTLPLTNLRIRAVMEEAQSFLSASGVNAIRAEGAQLASETLPALAPGAEVSWQVRVRAVKAADVRFQVELLAEPFSRPVAETEATMQY